MTPRDRDGFTSGDRVTSGDGDGVTSGDGVRNGVRHRAGDRGSVTAELAVGLPVVVLVLVALIAVSAAAIAQARCADGSRAGARAAALGEDDATVVATARRVAGAEVDVQVDRSGGWASVTVTDSVGPWRGVPLRAASTSVARDEP